MNLKSVYAHAGDEFALPRPQKTLVCPDHELICLAYQEALKCGWDAGYDTELESGEYLVSVYDCSLDEFASILQAAEENKGRAHQGLAGQRVLPFDARCVA